MIIEWNVKLEEVLLLVEGLQNDSYVIKVEYTGFRGEMPDFNTVPRVEYLEAMRAITAPVWAFVDNKKDAMCVMLKHPGGSLQD